MFIILFLPVSSGQHLGVNLGNFKSDQKRLNRSRIADFSICENGGQPSSMFDKMDCNC